MFAFHRECYVTIDEIETVKKFKAAINRTFAERGGVIWQGITDRQLSIYIMDKLKEFAGSAESKKYHGSLIIGRQPNYRKVDANGEFVNDPENKPGISMEENKIKQNDFDTAVYIFNDRVQVYV